MGWLGLVTGILALASGTALLSFSNGLSELDPRESVSNIVPFLWFGIMLAVLGAFILWKKRKP
jgi:LPXTG-motif cell wall-anchored protein